jgi:hypothetical protein
MSKHTLGRVKVQHPHAGERGWEVAFEPGLEQLCQNITEANARRLVACWNALQDFSTEEIENSRFKPVSNGNWGGRSMDILRESVRRGLHLSDDGRLVLSNGRHAKLGNVKKEGYRVIQLGVDGRRALLTVARVVCFLAHSEPPTPDHVADHIDGDKLNDHPSNLRWATRSENVRNLRKPSARAAIAKATGGEA